MFTIIRGTAHASGKELIPTIEAAIAAAQAGLTGECHVASVSAQTERCMDSSSSWVNYKVEVSFVNDGMALPLTSYP